MSADIHVGGGGGYIGASTHVAHCLISTFFPVIDWLQLNTWHTLAGPTEYGNFIGFSSDEPGALPKAL